MRRHFSNFIKSNKGTVTERRFDFEFWSSFLFTHANSRLNQACSERRRVDSQRFTRRHSSRSRLALLCFFSPLAVALEDDVTALPLSKLTLALVFLQPPRSQLALGALFAGGNVNKEARPRAPVGQIQLRVLLLVLC